MTRNIKILHDFRLENIERRNTRYTLDTRVDRLLGCYRMKKHGGIEHLECLNHRLMLFVSSPGSKFPP